MINKIDKQITNQVKKIHKFVNGLKFEEVYSFQLTNEIDNELLNTLKYNGLYLIEVRVNENFSNYPEWLKDLKTRWEDEKYIKRHTPNFKKKRSNAHSNLQEWMPLYLGKSKDICSRVKGHFNLGLEKPTYALKLRARENLKNEIFRLSTIKVEVSNYDTIMPIIESDLRDRINPLIGRQ